MQDVSVPSGGSRPESALAHMIRDVVARSLPLAWRGRPLDDAMPLGADGVGLDSVGIVELLLSCEDATGLPFAADVLESGPLTIGRLVRHATERTALSSRT